MEWLVRQSVFILLFHLLMLLRREDSTAFSLHPCLHSTEPEADHLRLVTETFISELLPSSFATNPFVWKLLREILTCKGCVIFCFAQLKNKLCVLLGLIIVIFGSDAEFMPYAICTQAPAAMHASKCSLVGCLCDCHLCCL